MGTQNENQEYIDALMAKIRPVGDYRETFKAHCTDVSPRISTGYLNFDRVLNGGLANELYIMGAETSTGKSAFYMSLAQNVAAAGTDVLYFALEMGYDECIARAISSISYEHHLKAACGKAYTAGNILYWQYDNLLKEFTKLSYSCYANYADEYFDRYGTHLHIIESGISGLTVKDIANMASLYKKETGRPVAVFVDYLQLIKADPNDRSQADRKGKTDACVTTLKALASQVGMPVLTISSISRNNYGGRIGTAAFKESGDTEYTGGILLGWNWDGVTNQQSAEAIEKEKERCRERGYRDVMLEILKYRNAERDNAVWLKYYPAYNYFVESSGPNRPKTTDISRKLVR